MDLPRRAVQRNMLKLGWIKAADELVATYLGDVEPVDGAHPVSDATRSVYRKLRLPGSESKALLIATRAHLLLYRAYTDRYDWMYDFVDVSAAGLPERVVDLVFIGDPPPRCRFRFGSQAEADAGLAEILGLRASRLAASPLEERVLREKSQAEALSKVGEYERAAQDCLGIIDSGVEPYAASALVQLGSIRQRQGDLAAAETYLRRAEQSAPRHIAAAAACQLALMALRRVDLATAHEWADRAEHLDPDIMPMAKLRALLVQVEADTRAKAGAENPTDDQIR